MSQFCLQQCNTNNIITSNNHVIDIRQTKNMTSRDRLNKRVELLALKEKLREITMLENFSNQARGGFFKVI